jgi:hypothetical protein
MPTRLPPVGEDRSWSPERCGDLPRWVRSAPPSCSQTAVIRGGIFAQSPVLPQDTVTTLPFDRGGFVRRPPIQALFAARVGLFVGRSWQGVRFAPYGANGLRWLPFAPVRRSATTRGARDKSSRCLNRVRFAPALVGAMRRFTLSSFDIHVHSQSDAARPSPSRLTRAGRA